MLLKDKLKEYIVANYQRLHIRKVVYGGKYYGVKKTIQGSFKDLEKLLNSSDLPFNIDMTQQFIKNQKKKLFISDSYDTLALIMD